MEKTFLIFWQIKTFSLFRRKMLLGFEKKTSYNKTKNGKIYKRFILHKALIRIV